MKIEIQLLKYSNLYLWLWDLNKFIFLWTVKILHTQFNSQNWILKLQPES